MATRYAGKYRRSPYPQATRMKAFNFLRYLSLRGTFWHLPKDKFSFFTGGDDYFYWGGTCAPHPPYFAHWCDKSFCSPGRVFDDDTPYTKPHN